MKDDAPPAVPGRPLTGLMRTPLLIAAGIILALGLDLTLFPASTETTFSWTIEPPLTALVFSGLYLAAFVILVAVMRDARWHRVRVVLPGGIAFSTLVVIATFIHLSKFHLSGPDPTSRAVAWIWLIAYLALPPALLVAVPGQRKVPGNDPARRPAYPGIRVGELILSGLMVSAGALLFLAPDLMIGVWPWALTPLTSRVLGSWSIGLGLVFMYAASENDREVMFGPSLGMAVFGILEAMALVRMRHEVAWDATAAWLLVGVLAASTVWGVAGAVTGRGVLTER